VASLEMAVCPILSGRLRKTNTLVCRQLEAHRTEDVHSEDIRGQTAWRRVVPVRQPSGCVYVGMYVSSFNLTCAPTQSKQQNLSILREAIHAIAQPSSAGGLQLR